MARSTFYRAIRPHRGAEQRRPKSHRRIPDDLRRQIINIMNSERFCDKAPPEIFAALLSEGTYRCSVRTMYRILAENRQNVQRRQAHPRSFARPELLATRPNQVWSWDITKLKGQSKWTYYYLYTILDIFSRYVVGWMVAYRESATLAEALIADTCLKQEIVPGTLSIHADRGASMTSRPVACLLADLGITKTHSRPYVSNDNPYSESAFKTLKYHPDFPDRFGSIHDSRSYCQMFFHWYNHDHHHSGIAMFMPYQLHYGLVERIAQQRNNALKEAYLKNPERFVNGLPCVKLPPKEVWINKPTVKEQLQNNGLITNKQLSHLY